MRPTTAALSRSSGIVALLLLMNLPVPASGQASAVVIPRGRLTLEEARETSGLRFEPTDRALRWLAGDTLLVSHYEVYSSVLAFFVNCPGSGFFKVPVSGGRAVAVGEPFCLLNRNLTAAPDGATVLLFGDPAYARDGPITVKTGDAPLLAHGSAISFGGHTEDRMWRWLKRRRLIQHWSIGLDWPVPGLSGHRPVPR